MTTLNNPQGGNMHPDDKRNLIFFFLACIGAFFIYDIFVARPHQAALKEQQAKVAAAQATAVDNDATQGPLTLDQALAAGPRVQIDNPDLVGSINLKGGRIDNLALKSYFTTVENTTPVTLLAPARTPNPLYADFGWLPGSGVTAALPGNDTQWRVKGNNILSKDTPVVLTWANGQGLVFERSYALDEHYMFTVTQTVTNNSRQPVTLHPFALISRQGLPVDFKPIAILHEGPIGLFDDGLEEVDYKDLDKKPRQDFTAAKGWAGFTDKYWFTGLVAANEAGNPNTYRFMRSEGRDAPVYQVDMTGAAVTVTPGQTATDTVRSYVGPKKLSLLNDYADKLGIDRFDLVIDFGMFWFLTIPFFHILTWLGHSVGSFAIALLVFTCILRLMVFPLANKSYRSFARMRKIQPQMLEVREKYGDDRAKLQAAIFELYKKENVNPMAGCLPILIQIPIFFSLYKVLYISIDMRHAPFWGWIDDMSAPDPTSVFTLFGAIPVTLPQFLIIGVWPVIMGITMFMQQRMNPPAQDPIQAKVLGLMPLMMLFLMAHFPAGLVIYWSWSNFLSLIQQYVLMRQEGVQVHFLRRSKEDKVMADKVAHGPNVHPELDVLEHEAKEAEEKVERAITPPKPKKKR